MANKLLQTSVYSFLKGSGTAASKFQCAGQRAQAPQMLNASSFMANVNSLSRWNSSQIAANLKYSLCFKNLVFLPFFFSFSEPSCLLHANDTHLFHNLIQIYICNLPPLWQMRFSLLLYVTVLLVTAVKAFRIQLFFLKRCGAYSILFVTGISCSVPLISVKLCPLITLMIWAAFAIWPTLQLIVGLLEPRTDLYIVNLVSCKVIIPLKFWPLFL